MWMNAKHREIKEYLTKIKNNIRIIGFDLDGVLVNLKYDKYIWNSLIPREYAKIKNIKLKQAKDEVYNAYKEAIGINEWTSLEYWFRRFNVNVSPSEILRKALHKLEIYKDTKILGELHKKYELIILTQSPMHFIDIKTKTFNKYFSDIYSSPDTYKSLRKEKEVYLKILKKHKIKPHEMLYIGDNLEFDYMVPKSIGINTIYLNRRKKRIKGIRCIKTLMTLRGLLK
jgi:putative hydrolase of the HAD superfamily